MFYIPLCFILAGCKPTLIAEFEDKPVVNCYLDAGKSPQLTISKLIAFRDDVAYADQDIDALIIKITDETTGEEFTMQPAGAGRYDNPAFTVQAEHSYALHFTYDNKPVRASATVPPSPENVSFSDTSIGTGGFGGMGGIEITWDNDDRNYYLVEGVTESASPIRESETAPAKSFRIDYTQENSITLSSMQFSYFGNYAVSLIRIEPEYVVMTQSVSNTSSSLADVRGNIEGGYGIFTGINRVTKTIQVYQQTGP